MFGKSIGHNYICSQKVMSIPKHSCLQSDTIILFSKHPFTIYYYWIIYDADRWRNMWNTVIIAMVALCTQFNEEQRRKLSSLSTQELQFQFCKLCVHIHLLMIFKVFLKCCYSDIWGFKEQVNSLTIFLSLIISLSTLDIT